MNCRKLVKLIDNSQYYHFSGYPCDVTYVTSQKAHDATETFQVLNYTLNL